MPFHVLKKKTIPFRREIRGDALRENLQKSHQTGQWVHGYSIAYEKYSRVSCRYNRSDKRTQIHSVHNFYSEFKAKHDVLAPPSIVNDVSVDRLNEGNRVYVTGVIRYSDFLSADGRPKQQGQIIPSNIIPCEQNEDPASGNFFKISINFDNSLLFISSSPTLWHPLNDEPNFSDINEVNLFGSVKSKPEITENATFFKVTVAIPWKER